MLCVWSPPSREAEDGAWRLAGKEFSRIYLSRSLAFTSGETWWSRTPPLRLALRNPIAAF